MRTFGLTGGIGSGKSTVARHLREHHRIPIIDADLVARQVVEPGTPALAAIADTFGAAVLQPDGRLDRAAMRRVITADPEARRQLEAITHPRIAEVITAWMAEQRAAGATVCGVEAALMVETGSWRRHDDLVVVVCSPEIQLQRVMQRDGMAEADARRLIAAQLPMAEKVRVATWVIHNDGSLDELRRSSDVVAGRLMDAAGREGGGEPRSHARS